MWKNLKIEIILLLGAFTWIIFSYFYSFGTKPETWFARSGSIMVLLSVIVEYKLAVLQQNKINRAIQKSSYIGMPARSKLSKEYNYISTVTHVFVILGTLIWGYGDLLN